MINMITVYFDGACGPRNPGGKCGGGAAIYYDGELVAEIAERFIPKNPRDTSNNLGEYWALTKGLEYLLDQGKAQENIQVYGDSNLVISQMTGRWRIKHGTYAEQAKICRKLVANFTNINFTWIPREQNERADELSKIALRKSITYSY